VSSDTDSDMVRIRVKSGSNELEIDAKRADLQDALGAARGLFQLLGEAAANAAAAPPTSEPAIAAAIHIDSKASLPNIVVKLFESEWGSKPRRLKEIKEQLERMGMIYPKQSIAVSLLRLAKEGEIRRFRGDEGDYLYVGAPKGA